MLNPLRRRILKYGYMARSTWESRALNMQIQTCSDSSCDQYSDKIQYDTITTLPSANVYQYHDFTAPAFNRIDGAAVIRIAGNGQQGGNPAEIEWLVDVRNDSTQYTCVVMGVLGTSNTCTMSTTNMLQVEVVPWVTWFGSTNVGYVIRSMVYEATGYTNDHTQRHFIVFFNDPTYTKMVLVKLTRAGNGQIQVARVTAGYAATLGNNVLPTSAQINTAWANRVQNNGYDVARTVIRIYAQRDNTYI